MHAARAFSGSSRGTVTGHQLATATSPAVLVAARAAASSADSTSSGSRQFYPRLPNLRCNRHRAHTLAPACADRRRVYVVASGSWLPVQSARLGRMPLIDLRLRRLLQLAFAPAGCAILAGRHMEAITQALQPLLRGFSDRRPGACAFGHHQPPWSTRANRAACSSS